MADNTLLHLARSLARRRGMSFSRLVRCALADYVAKAFANTTPSFVGVGASGGKLRLSERAEELLFGQDRRSSA